MFNLVQPVQSEEDFIHFQNLDIQSKTQEEEQKPLAETVKVVLKQEVLQPSSEASSTSPSTLTKKKVTILRFIDLDQNDQRAALKAVIAINRVTSTQPGSTWNSYSQTIQDRLRICENSKNTFFVAKVEDQFVGYVAFYTRKDRISYINKFLDNDSEAYCSWTAVDDKFKGQGIAEKLKIEIFKDPKIVRFKGHIKKTNDASLRVLEKFGVRGYHISSEDAGHQVYYSVQKVETVQEGKSTT